MEIYQTPLGEIKTYENNPRNNENAIDKVAASIKEFGFKVPLILDKDSYIVAGHTRFEASKRLGLKSVPVIVADDLNDEQIKLFRLVDNRVSELSTWDDRKLLKELQELGDMRQYGFSEKDYEQLDDLDDFELDDVGIEVSSQYGLNVIVASAEEQNELHERLQQSGFKSKKIKI